MQVSEKCVNLLKTFNSSNVKSNILITDLKTIQYGIVDEKNDITLDYDNYWHKPLSKDMLNLIKEWQNKEFSKDLYLLLNDNFKKIVENDEIEYFSQMIFPLFFDNKLDGLAIFFKTKRSLWTRIYKKY